MQVNWDVCQLTAWNLFCLLSFVKSLGATYDNYLTGIFFKFHFLYGFLFFKVFGQ